jgi:hypothetical protein
MSATHERWIRRLCRTWPEGVPAHQPEPGEKRTRVEPWPDTGAIPKARRCNVSTAATMLSFRVSLAQIGAPAQMSNRSMTASSSLSTGLAAIGPRRMPSVNDSPKFVGVA